MVLRYLLSFLGFLTLVHTAHGQEIHKCIVNGKTVYSDEKCPSNSVRKPVELHHASGVVSPDRATVEDTMNRIRDENWVNAVPGRSITRTTTRGGHTTIRTVDNPLPQAAPYPVNNKKATCDAISARIDELDSWARQPRSAQSQDWIRQEREKERTEQFRLRCQ